MLDRLIDLFIRFVRLFQFFTVMNEFERGVVLRLGKYNRTLGPGFHWLIPFYIDIYYFANVVPESYDVRNQSLTTADGIQVAVGIVLFYGISDIRKFVIEVEDAESVLINASKGVVAGIITSYDYDELVMMDLAQEIYPEIAAKALNYGIDVREVAISDFCKARSLRLMGVSGT